MNFRHRRHCGCQKPVKQIVHPVKENVVHCCTQETVKHIHPSHTTVMNHHLIKNKHVFPHSTSFGNTVNEVDVFGGAFNTPPMGMGPGGVGGAMSPGMGPGSGAGGMSLGMGPGVMGAQTGCNKHVAGSQHQHHQHKPHHKHNHNKWC